MASTSSFDDVSLDQGPEKRSKTNPTVTIVQKFFNESVEPYYGYVKEFNDPYYWIVYDDGDEEEIELAELQELRIPSDGDSFRVVPRMNPLLCPSATKSLAQIYGKASLTTEEEFFLFLLERQRIWERRSRGDSWPWTADPFLQTLSFCNVYRELDRGTQFFRAHVLTIPWKKGRNRQILFHSYLYRLVNRKQSFERTGFPHPDLKALKSYWKRVTSIRSEGSPFFTGAHQTTNYESLLQGLKEVINVIDTVMDDILAAPTVPDVLGLLKTLPNVGDFFAWQIYCDLVESAVLKSYSSDHCWLGPGARNGLLLISRSKSVFTKLTPIEQAKRLVSRQNKVYAKFGVAFPYWRGQRLTLKEIEHGLCEFCKYDRVRKGGSTAKNVAFPPRDPDEVICCDLCHHARLENRGICAGCGIIEKAKLL